MKDIFVADLSGLEEGRAFDGYFLVLHKQQRMTKSNKPYLNLILADKTGQVEARIWDPGDARIARDVEKGDIVKVRGAASRFDDRMQVKVDQMRRAHAGEAEKTDMLPSTEHDVEEMWRRLEGFIDSFTEANLQRLLRAMLSDPRVSTAFREAPAAKQLHHAWLGGLLEHVVSLLTLADRLAPHYPMLHRDLLLTGVILHDIGKIHELSWAMGFDYTVEGHLLGHIQMGVAMTERAIDALPDFPSRLKTLVLHMILAHHGKLEFGSPKLPMIPEALALNFLDDLDAKMEAMELEFAKCAQEGRPADELTGKVWALDQRMLLSTKGWLEGDPALAPAPEPSGPLQFELLQALEKKNQPR